jgi:hypothetical protein
MQGCAPCMAVVFLLAQKDDRKMRQGFPPALPSLSFGDDAFDGGIANRA